MLCRLNNSSPKTKLASPLGAEKRAYLIGLLVGSLSLLLLFSLPLPKRFLVLNLSPSVPLGFYVAVKDKPAVGRLVEFNYRRPNCICGCDQFILKPILAGPGDCVDTTGEWLLINDRRIAPIATHDSKGHALELWRGNRILNPGEFFVYSDRVPNSFDSRCFGPVRQQDIVAVRKPLWVWSDSEVHDVDPENGDFRQLKSDSIDKE